MLVCTTRGLLVHFPAGSNEVRLFADPDRRRSAERNGKSHADDVIQFYILPPSLLTLASWQNFYVIAGSSAGALTGLQFVVITLIAQSRAAGSMREIRAFGTPTVIHFCTALLISALTAAPWQTLTSFGVIIGFCGIAGIIYSLTVFVHAYKAEYTPDLEDWIWYTCIPFLAHLGLAAAALLLFSRPAWGLVTIAADTLLFLLLGVRNAWDTVTYIAVHRGQHARNAGSSITDDAEQSSDRLARPGSPE